VNPPEGGLFYIARPRDTFCLQLHRDFPFLSLGERDRGNNRHVSFGYPEGNFEGNQLLEDSMSLSPLHQTQTNELHVSIDTGFHPSFPGLHRTLE